MMSLPITLNAGANFAPNIWRLHGRHKNAVNLVLAGALAEPIDGAVLLFKGDSPEAAEAFAQTDPYVKHGLIARWRVRPWTTVVGDDAANPISAN